MAPMLSAIALLVLATGCFTLPMDTKYPKTTPVPSSQWEMTTGSLFIDHKDNFNMHLMSSQESTDIPNIHHPRILPNGQSTLELTTSTLELSTRSPRSENIDEQSENEREERGTKYSSTTLTPEVFTTGAPSKLPYNQYQNKNASVIQHKRQDDGDNGDDQEEITNMKRGISDDDDEEVTQWKRQYGGDSDENQDEVSLGERQYGGDSDENQDEATLGERSIDDKDEEEITHEKRQYDGDDSNGDDNTEQQKREIEDEEEAERAVDNDEEEETERDVEDEEETERSVEDEEEKTERDVENEEETERSVEDEDETERDVEDDESLREERLETPTSSSSSFTQTSSTVAPQLYTSDPSNSSVVNFGKYTGLLADDKPAPKKVNKVYQPRKHVNKTYLTTTTVMPDHADDESKAPIAQLDQSGSGNVPNVKSQWLNLEDNNVAPNKVPAKKYTTATPTDKYVKVQAAPIAQGKQPVQLKEKESDN